MQKRECTLVPATMPAPAPLPSLTSALSRRAALFGAVASGGFLAAAGAAAVTYPAADPADARLVQIHQTATELRAYFDRDDVMDETADEAYDKIGDMRVEAFDLRATTPAGALASLLMAREEFARYYVDIVDPDWLNRWTLAMVDNAISVLQAEVVRR